MSKPKMRARLRSLSFSEKIQILEKLRDRSLTIAASGLRPRAALDGHIEAAKRKDCTVRRRMAKHDLKANGNLDDGAAIGGVGSEPTVVIGQRTFQRTSFQL